MRDAVLGTGQRSGRPTAFRIAFVCSGNICRSPMAEVVIRAKAAEHGLEDVVTVESSGTGDWHVGEQADRRALAALAARGYDGARHRARQFEPADFPAIDLVVALDEGHERALRSWARSPRDRAKVRLLRSFDPDADDPEVADPYYGADEDFETVLDQLEAAADGLLQHVRRELGR
jgi:protein-tyrosine phosphatase